MAIVLTPAQAAQEKVNRGFELARQISPEVFGQNYLGRLDEGKLTQGFGNVLNNYQSLSSTSTDTGDLLSRMKAGLSGLQSPELTAMRDRGSLELRRQYQSGLSALNRYRGASGLGGGVNLAAVRNLNRDRMLGAGQNEQDLMLKNVAVQDARTQAYGSAMQAENERRLAANAGYSDAALKQLQSRKDIDTYNMEQGAKELAGRTAAIGGGMDIYGGAVKDKKEDDRFDKAIKLNKKIK